MKISLLEQEIFNKNRSYKETDKSGEKHEKYTYNFFYRYRSTET
jgi:hypothetical protein